MSSQLGDVHGHQGRKQLQFVRRQLDVNTDSISRFKPWIQPVDAQADALLNSKDVRFAETWCGCHTRITSRRIDHSTASTSLRVASSMPFFCSASIASSMTVMNSCSLMFMPLCVATMSLPV